MIFQPVNEDLAMVMKFISNSAVVHLSANTYQQLNNPIVVSITANLSFALNRWNNNYTGWSNHSAYLTAAMIYKLVKYLGPGVAPSFAVPNTPHSPTGSSTSAANPSQADMQGAIVHNLPLTVDPLLASGWYS